jgi:thiaminase
VTSFTQELWASIEPIYRAILSHPFLKGLADGTLPEEKFRLHWGSRGKETMKGHFIATSRYEWMFWDMAWRSPLAGGRGGCPPTKP